MTRRTTIALAAGAVLLLGAVAGCSGDDKGDSTASPTTTSPSPSGTLAPLPTTSPDPSAGEFVKGTLDGVTLPDGEVAAGAGWAEDGRLWVLTFGSSSNPDIVKQATVDGQTITLVVEAVDPNGMATADFQPTTSFIEVDDSVDRTQPAEVVISKGTTVTITEGEPGWDVK